MPSLLLSAEDDPLLSVSGAGPQPLSENESVPAVSAAPQVSTARVIYAATPRAVTVEEEEHVLQDGGHDSDQGSRSSRCSHCSSMTKRSQRNSPPSRYPLVPPSQEELVEWVFYNPDMAPNQLAVAALQARDISPGHVGALAQQADIVRRTMVHYARLVLLSHQQAQLSPGGTGMGYSLERDLLSMAMRGTAPPAPK